LCIVRVTPDSKLYFSIFISSFGSSMIQDTVNKSDEKASNEPIASSEEASTLSNLSLWPPTLCPLPSLTDTDELLGGSSSHASSFFLPPIISDSIKLKCFSGSSSSASTAGVRCYFHPEKEVPLLKDWYQCNQRPTTRLFLHYTDVLNQSAIRLER